MREAYQFKVEDAERFARESGIETFRRGTELHFKYCPYCKGGKNHDKDTFSINLLTGLWNCKRGSCQSNGNMINLVQDFSWFSLGNEIDDIYLKRERYRRFIRREIKTADKAVEYMRSRGIPEEITRKYEITMHSVKKNVLVFPFIDERNDLWFIKYRNIEYKKGDNGSKEWCEKNRKPILFGMNHCNFENEVLVLTEGQIDSLSCAAAGIENAVSVPTGKNGFTWVPNCWNFLGRFNELIVFGDYENGSISLLEEMKTRFNHGRIKHVRPEDYLDCKDANEILVKYGPEQIRKCIENAVQIPVQGIKRMADVQRMRIADLDRMYTGIVELDEKCPFVFGELIVLTGAAGEGKSTMASQWVTKALDQGYPSMIYSGEMPSWLVKNWIDLQIAGKKNLNLRDDIEQEVYEQIISWDAYQNLYVYDVDDAENNQETLLRVLMKGIQQYGIRFIVIDNLMTAMDYNNNLELNDAQTVFTKKLANIAQNNNVIIVLIVHPRKSKSGIFSNDDIAGSSNITNRAHKTIRYSRPDKEFLDLDGKEWRGDELPDCPIRMLTVLKDRISGRTINKGIPLYFEEKTKRIWDGSTSTGFDWKLGWEKPQFTTDVNMDEVPF